MDRTLHSSRGRQTTNEEVKLDSVACADVCYGEKQGGGGGDGVLAQYRLHFKPW